MTTVQVRDKLFEKSIDAETIDGIVQKLAKAINRDYAGENPLFVCLLNGSFVFAADLLRKITIPCQVTFVKVASYKGTSSTGEVHQLIGLSEDIAGRHIIIVEDIVNTGITMDFSLKELKKHHPADIRLACFFFKKEAFRMSFPIDYLGMSIPNEFIVGYGLDYDGFGRNLPDIYKIVKS